VGVWYLQANGTVSQQLGSPRIEWLARVSLRHKYTSELAVCGSLAGCTLQFVLLLQL
jgi:hypothetical protein